MTAGEPTSAARRATRRALIRASATLASAAFAVASACAIGGCEGLIGATFDVQRVSCTHVAPPPPPAPGRYGGSAGAPSITLAAYTVDVGESGGHASMGYDQDGLCTNRSQGPSCQKTTWLAADDTDGVDGRDNGVGNLIGAQKRFFNAQFLTSAQLTSNIQSGKAPPLVVVRISDYDNLTEDEAVTVEWFLAAVPSGDAAAPDWSSYAVSIEDGTTLLGLDGLPRALDVDPHAYVHDGTLVARFDHGATIRLGSTAFRLATAIFTAERDPDRGFVAATVAGKLATKEFFTRLPEFTSFIARNDVCKDNALYPQIKAYACSFEDIRVDGRTDPSIPCDALSIGLNVTTHPVTLGASRASPYRSPCTPDTDPSTDNCAAAIPAADAGSGHDPSKNCVKPGTPNNERGIGGYCETLDQCPLGSLCTAQFGAADDAWFCSQLCVNDSTCGSNAYCAYNSRGHQCVPFACGSPDAGPDGSSPGDASSDAAPDGGDPDDAGQ